MGWFSDLFTPKETKEVKGICQRMLDDKSFMYAHKKALYNWIFDKPDNRAELSNYLISYSNASMPKKFKKAYNWAKSYDNFAYGLPTSEVTVDPVGLMKKAVDDYLTSREGNVEVLGVTVGAKNFYLEGWKKLKEQYGYNGKTNELTGLSRQKGTKCYLEDAYLVVNTNTAQEYNKLLKNDLLSYSHGKLFDERETDYKREAQEHKVGNQNKLVVTYAWQNKKTREVPKDPSKPNGEKETEITYTKETSEFTIDLSHINKTLHMGDKIEKEPDYISAIYTVGDETKFFEYTWKSGGIPSLDNTLPKQNTLGMYYPRMHLRISGNDMYRYDANPSLRDSTKKLFKRIGMNAETVTKELIKNSKGDYKFFFNIYFFVGASVNTAGKSVVAEYLFRYFERLYNNFGEEPLMQDIKDTVSSQRLGYQKIEYERGSGYCSYKGETLKDDEFCVGYHGSYHAFVKQMNGEYIELRVYGLSQSNEMQGYTTAHSGADENLVIAVDGSLLDDMTNKERQLLFHKCLHIQITYVRINRQSFWETIGFKIILVAVGIAITVLTGGAGGMTLAAAFKTAMIGAAKGIALSFAVQAFVSIAVSMGLSPEVAQIIVIIAGAVAVAYGAGWDMSKILSAPNMMKLMNSAFDIYTKTIEMKFKQIQKDMLLLEKEFKSQKEKIDELAHLLNTKVFKPSLEQLTTSFKQVDCFETPDLFMARHYGYNVTNASTAMTSSFALMSLRKRTGLYEVDSVDIDNVLLLS